MSISSLLGLPPDVCRAIGGILLTFAVGFMVLLAFYWNELGPRPPRAPKPRKRPDDKLR